MSLEFLFNTCNQDLCWLTFFATLTAIFPGKTYNVNIRLICRCISLCSRKSAKERKNENKSLKQWRKILKKRRTDLVSLTARSEEAKRRSVWLVMAILRQMAASCEMLKSRFEVAFIASRKRRLFRGRPVTGRAAVFTRKKK